MSQGIEIMRDEREINFRDKNAPTLESVKKGDFIKVVVDMGNEDDWDCEQFSAYLKVEKIKITEDGYAEMVLAGRLNDFIETEYNLGLARFDFCLDKEWRYRRYSAKKVGGKTKYIEKK
jgi:hypothetical protein